MFKIKLSVIVVNFNTGDFLESCLESLEDALKGISSEVFVVDNASSDESFKRVQEKFKFNFLPQVENLGFGKEGGNELMTTTFLFQCSFIS